MDEEIHKEMMNLEMCEMLPHLSELLEHLWPVQQNVGLWLGPQL